MNPFLIAWVVLVIVGVSVWVLRPFADMRWRSHRPPLAVVFRLRDVDVLTIAALALARPKALWSYVTYRWAVWTVKPGDRWHNAARDLYGVVEATSARGVLMRCYTADAMLAWRRGRAPASYTREEPRDLRQWARDWPNPPRSLRSA